MEVWRGGLRQHGLFKVTHCGSDIGFAESSGCSANAVFFHGPPSYLVVLAADAAILVCSRCLAQDVREARSQDNSDSCAIALSWEMTQFSLFLIFCRFCGALDDSQL